MCTYKICFQSEKKKISWQIPSYLKLWYLLKRREFADLSLDTVNFIFLQSTID